MNKIFSIILVMCIGIGLIGCTAQDVPDDAECQSLEYEIMDENDVSQKIKEKMYEKREDPYNFKYTDGKDMYVAIGYGAKPTGGYSIKIISVEQCGEYIIVNTELIEPSKEDVVTLPVSYPSIILKMDASDYEVRVKIK